MNEVPLYILLILSLTGIAVAGYLLRERVKKKPVVCPINGQCEKVLNSKYNQIFGIHNDILGVAYYTLIAIVTLGVLLLGIEYPFIIKLASLGSALFSAFLVYLQAYVLRAYCFYCITSAVINFLILGFSLI